MTDHSKTGKPNRPSPSDHLPYKALQAQLQTKAEMQAESSLVRMHAAAEATAE